MVKNVFHFKTGHHRLKAQTALYS